MSSKDAIICTQCRGDGHLRLRFEAEESVRQCWVCNSQGEVKKDKHFIQSWEESGGSRAHYYGPLLDPQHFKKYKVHKEKKVHKER